MDTAYAVRDVFEYCCYLSRYDFLLNKKTMLMLKRDEKVRGQTIGTHYIR